MIVREIFSISSSVNVFSIGCKITLNAILFLFSGNLPPSKTSKILTFLIFCLSIFLIALTISAVLTSIGNKKAKSLSTDCNTLLS